jgi:hypothetical protein
MAGTEGSVEAFLAESVATLTRPFPGEGEGIDADMAGTEGSVETFLAESVATLTRPFACDAAGLDALSPADRAAVRRCVPRARARPRLA